MSFLLRLQKLSLAVFVGNFDDIDVDQFVEESLKMSRFKHAHVMGLIGLCLDAGSAPYIVMPYMANGSLLKYLKKERKNLVFSEDADEDEVGIIIPHSCIIKTDIFNDTCNAHHMH